jgi:phosphate transport system permease protein
MPQPNDRISFGARLRELLFRRLMGFSSIFVVLIIVSFFVTLFIFSLPSIKLFGFHFISGTTWDPVSNVFGALPFLVGTLLTAVLALIISTPFAISVALFLGEYFPSGFLSGALKSIVELLAGIPSVIYGFWGLFFLTPIIRSLEMKFGVAPYGVGILNAALILAIMVIPYSASIAREVISLVPQNLKEAAYGLGCTRFEVIWKVIVPYARSGVVAGTLLAFGRAVGETMAVTMVIGNSNFLPKTLFDPSNTMASVIANEFTEATGQIYLSSLIEIGLLLLIVTTIVNFVGKIIIKRMSITVQ